MKAAWLLVLLALLVAGCDHNEPGDGGSGYAQPDGPQDDRHRPPPPVREAAPAAGMPGVDGHAPPAPLK